MSEGATHITHCLKSGDVGSTLQALRSLGVSIEERGETLIVEGKAGRSFTPPQGSLDMGNSGTTTRLLLGLLAGHPFPVTLTGDASLSKRPMARVAEPLVKMGATIRWGENGENFLPLTIQGGKLHGIDYRMTVPSAQVKSAILLAGLYADGPTQVQETIPTRDHTERMLRYLGAKLEIHGSTIVLTPGGRMKARDLTIPGDFSSAAFFLTAAAIVPGSSVTVQGVGLNATRIGLLELLKRMGARLCASLTSKDDWELVGDVTLTSSPLHGVTVEPGIIPSAIDELPILMVAATQARGRTILRDAKELRVKETDRIRSMVTGLKSMGAQIWEEEDTVIIEGPAKLRGTQVNSFSDHRTAMSLAVAGLVAEGPTTIEESQWIDISFTDFLPLLQSICST